MNWRHGDTIGDKFRRIREQLHRLSPSRQCRQRKSVGPCKKKREFDRKPIATRCEPRALSVFTLWRHWRHWRHVENDYIFLGDKIGLIGDKRQELATL
jgi:hypothetical protein